MTAVFTHCANGHDLTVEDAYIYNSGGTRACRECVKNAVRKGGKKTQVYSLYQKG